VAALACAGAWRSYQVAGEYNAAFADVHRLGFSEARLAAIAERVPANAKVGLITDLDAAGQGYNAYHAALLGAQNAIAPRMLYQMNDGARPEWALGNFFQPLDFAARGEQLGYVVEADLGNGVILYRRKAR